VLEHAGYTIKSIDGLLVSAWYKMTIQVYGYLYGRVAHLVSDVHETFALLKQQGGKGVTEIVETDLTEPGVFE